MLHKTFLGFCVVTVILGMTILSGLLFHHFSIILVITFFVLAVIALILEQILKHRNMYHKIDNHPYISL